MTTWKSPLYSPNTRENPNSPVAHQPNVSYDHRAGPQYAYPPPSPRPLQPQQPQYQPYAPPPHNYSAQGYVAQAASSGPLLGGIDKYAHANQSHQALPPYPYSQSSAQPPRPPPYPGQSTAPYGSPSQQGQAPPLHGGAPYSSMPGTPTGPPKPPMYAVTPHSSVVHAAQTPTEYLTYVMQYPYLKNAYLRRQKTYISPYSPGGGIAPEWMPKPPQQPPQQQQQQAAGATPMRAGSTGPHGFYHASPSPHTIAPRPAAQFQSPDAFQRGLTQASSAAAAAAPKWEQMLKQLATSTGAPGSSTVATPTCPATTTLGQSAVAAAGTPQQQQQQTQQQTQYPPLPRASTSYGMPNAPGPFKMHAPPSSSSGSFHLPPPPPPPPPPQQQVQQQQQQLKPNEPARPIPSPISDDGKANGNGVGVGVGVGVIDPALTALPSIKPTTPAAGQGVGKEGSAGVVGKDVGDGKEVGVKGVDGANASAVLGGETWRFSAP